MSIAGNISTVLVLGLLGFGICFSNTIEAAKALFGRRAWSFRRTPKYAIRSKGDDWRRKTYQVPLDPLNAAEAALAVIGVVATGYAIGRGSYGVAFLLLYYAAAFSFIVIMTFLQGRREGSR
jgi:hypothetical protein